jgi:signal transduction histidine kinase
VERLENIVSNFLSLAKETELHPEPHPIDPLVDDCLQLFRPDAEARRIVLISDLRAGQAESMIDLPHITRAVQNILLNALEACPPEGRIRVATGIVDGCCEILVENDGAGLSKDMVDHAFEPYYTTKPNGTGLGLAITRGIVEEHGGTIELSSPEGLGCRVRILLPGKNNPT